MKVCARKGLCKGQAQWMTLERQLKGTRPAQVQGEGGQSLGQDGSLTKSDKRELDWSQRAVEFGLGLLDRVLETGQGLDRDQAAQVEAHFGFIGLSERSLASVVVAFVIVHRSKHERRWLRNGALLHQREMRGKRGAGGARRMEANDREGWLNCK